MLDPLSPDHLLAGLGWAGPGTLRRNSRFRAAATPYHMSDIEKIPLIEFLYYYITPVSPRNPGDGQCMNACVRRIRI